MNILIPGIFLLFLLSNNLGAQSLEIMAGNKHLFADVQWLRFLDDHQHHWSVFSRSRATVDYDNNTDLFTGTYVNYTMKSGLGTSIVGKINSTEGAVDAGLHIFKVKSDWMLFGLASLGLKSDLEYSWFSILRYTPKVGAQWRLYTSLELFFLFQKNRHTYSVQRLRVGLDRNGFQFGLANNLSEFGKAWQTDNNFGGFIRKEF